MALYFPSLKQAIFKKMFFVVYGVCFDAIINMKLVFGTMPGLRRGVAVKIQVE